ncbi:alpha-1,3-mannosyl-glycoprotein 4-beta-N-acetylglucosaminyltransferase-like protein MGAT4E [Hippopotamus amphibius kiboko]|uniref:alpha-1,3-mannosyl-glycoprotein 4-beta-N-acetylglucosaminyltransferase-like protein MGAT4E n=1 Tax=Hippopotamus amphibius kiboko TaxID=575201 RepID=UPI0025962C82|nr:alpha-1,3-mannosyl-glycoprotein 4-beta-N-acetylglucosaminyltransferase-like protein MGAT4E [Hippopotamus amphibius kiboko]
MTARQGSDTFELGRLLVTVMAKPHTGDTQSISLSEGPVHHTANKGQRRLLLQQDTQHQTTIHLSRDNLHLLLQETENQAKIHHPRRESRHRLLQETQSWFRTHTPKGRAGSAATIAWCPGEWGEGRKWEPEDAESTPPHLCRAARGPSTMHRCPWKYIILAVPLIVLSVCLQERSEEHLKYSLLLEEKKKILWQLNQEQIGSKIKNHLEAFKGMQKTSPLLRRAKYKFLAGAPPQEKKLLTVGICAAQRPHGSHLLDTLQSLFRASSGLELECVVVLVSLSDSDPEQLRRTVANISDLFRAHIEAQQLLVIHGHLGGPPVPGGLNNVSSSSTCEALYSRQKADYALLMNFAANLSDYFLMLEDRVHCVPKFISTVYWALSAWKELPWVTLQFSSLSFSGQVFHSSDLPRLTSFFLLFHKDPPIHLLLSEFRLLLAQNIPIRFGSSLFYHMDSYSVLENTCFPAEKGKVFGEPDNPPASVRTDMVALLNDCPQHAYTLNSECFATLSPVKGNHLTVILEKPQKVTRIEVLTGSDTQRQYELQQGRVELGYSPLEDFKGCARYTLLGPLVEGHLDQMVSYEEDSVEALSCIRLLVLAPQGSWLLIRQIRVWTSEYEEEES